MSTIFSSLSPVFSALTATSMPISRFLSSFKSSNEAHLNYVDFEEEVLARMEALRISPSSHLWDAVKELLISPPSISFGGSIQKAVFQLRRSLCDLLGGIHVVFELPSNKLHVIWKDDQVIEILNDIICMIRKCQDTLKSIYKQGHENIQHKILSAAFPDEQKFLHWERLINSYAFRFLCLPIETPVYWDVGGYSLERLLSPRPSGDLKSVAEVPLGKEVNRLKKALEELQFENARLKEDLVSGVERVDHLNSKLERLKTRNARLRAQLDDARSESYRDGTREDAPPSYYDWDLEQYRSPDGSINISNVGNVSNVNAEYYIYRTTN